jgi:hypothetical protein
MVFREQDRFDSARRLVQMAAKVPLRVEKANMRCRARLLSEKTSCQTIGEGQ